MSRILASLARSDGEQVETNPTSKTGPHLTYERTFLRGDTGPPDQSGGLPEQRLGAAVFRGYIRPPWARCLSVSQRKRKAPQLLAGLFFVERRRAWDSNPQPICVGYRLATVITDLDGSQTARGRSNPHRTGNRINFGRSIIWTPGPRQANPSIPHQALARP